MFTIYAYTFRGETFKHTYISPVTTVETLQEYVKAEDIEEIVLIAEITGEVLTQIKYEDNHFSVVYADSQIEKIIPELIGE